MNAHATNQATARHTLSRADLEALLPHRGPIFACTGLTILAPLAFLGTARWDADHPVMLGHFPDLPLVPGVLLIEAATQLAGAGLQWNAQHAQHTLGTAHPRRIGVLASVQRCSFRRPVWPGQEVVFELACRPAHGAVRVSARVHVDGREVAQLATTIVYTARARLDRPPTT